MLSWCSKTWLILFWALTWLQLWTIKCYQDKLLSTARKNHRQVPIPQNINLCWILPQQLWCSKTCEPTPREFSSNDDVDADNNSSEGKPWTRMASEGILNRRWRQRGALFSVQNALCLGREASPLHPYLEAAIPCRDHEQLPVLTVVITLGAARWFLRAKADHRGPTQILAEGFSQVWLQVWLKRVMNVHWRQRLAVIMMGGSFKVS